MADTFELLRRKELLERKRALLEERSRLSGQSQGPATSSSDSSTLDVAQQTGATVQSTPTTLPEQLEAVNRGDMPEFKLPFTDKAGPFLSRIVASLQDDPQDKADMLTSIGYNATVLPSGQTVILNKDGTVSQLEEKEITAGDVADMGGAVLPTIGTLIGGAIGSPGSPLGSVAGATTGAMVGRGANEIISNFLGAKNNSPKAAIATEGAITAATSMLPMGAGALLSRTAKKGLSSPFRGQMDPTGTQARAMFQKEGADLPITSLSKSRLLAMLRSGASRSMGGGDIVEQETAQAKGALQKIVQDFSERQAPSLGRSELGEFAKEGFGVVQKQFQEQAEKRFDDLMPKLSGYIVTPSKTIQYLQDKLIENNLLDASGQLIRRTKMTPAPLTALQEMYARLTSSPTLDYQAIKRLRTQVRMATPGPQSPYSTGVNSIFKGVEGHLTDDMLNAADQIGHIQRDPTLKTQVADLNNWYRTKLQLFNGPTGKALDNTDPEKMVERIFRPGNVTEIRDARKILGDDYMGFLARQWLDNAVQGAISNTGEFVPGKLASTLLRQKDDSLLAMFPNQTQEIMDIRNAVISLTKGLSRNLNTSETASVLSILRSFTHPIEAISGILPGRLTAKALTSPGVKTYLTSGSKSPILNLIDKMLNKTGEGLKKSGPYMPVALQPIRQRDNPLIEQPTP